MDINNIPSTITHFEINPTNDYNYSYSSTFIDNLPKNLISLKLSSSFNLPVDNWVSLLIQRANPQDIRVRRDWYWITPEGKTRKPSRPCLLWIIRPKTNNNHE